MENRTFIIAEAGTSHMGNLEKGFELIDAAAWAGADCIKFQIVFADEIIHPESGLVDLPNGKIPLFEIFRSLEKDIEFYRKLKDHAKERKIAFLATPFGIRSTQILKKLDVDSVKIASPELNHYPLLDEVKKLGCRIILSTGVSTLSDIEKALMHTGKNTVLLHCITSYPAPEEEYNLKLIPTLSEVFGIPAGISDHSKDPVLVPVLSTLLGSRMIEKHITLSSTGEGLDDKIALDPDDFRIMAGEIRKAETTGSDEIIENLERRFSRERIRAVMGDGVKKLAESEKENYRTTNRSIIAVKDIKKGDVISSNNTALLRSEKNLKPGLPPDFSDIIRGKRVLKDIKSGEGIIWDCLLQR